jgi:FkbM family methyltransferase
MALIVREPLRFWFRVALRSRHVGRYRLRGSDVVFYLRHGTVDVMTLDQIAGAGHYDLPPPVAEALAAAGRPLRVVDLGANIGIFSAHIRRFYPDAELTAFEPNPANVEVLRRSIEANQGGPPWELVAACADVRDGTVAFWIGGEFTTSRIEGAASPATVSAPAVDVFPFLENADLVKIDIEGAEWPILRDPRFRTLRAAAVALEFHAHGCPDPQPGALARRLLEDAGYRTVETEFEAGPGHGMLWGWHTEPEVRPGETQSRHPSPP